MYLKTIVLDESNHKSANESVVEEYNSNSHTVNSSESPSRHLKNTMSDQHVSDEFLDYCQLIKSIHKTNEFTFIIDSGATSHMTPYVKCLVDYHTISGNVYLGNNKPLVITGSGYTRIM